MQSDRYGDIADLTRAVRVATPAGMLVTRPVPHTSTGPSVREMVLGSEGRLGIITEATVQVRRVPERRVILGYLFPSWSDGLAAMQDIAASETDVSVTRVSDPAETAFSFSTRKAPTVLDRIKSRALTTYLKRRRGFDIDAMCLSFIGYEGTETHTKAQRKATQRIVARHGGLSIGASPGELYDQKKFDTPYIRDFLLDRGTLGDVSETAAPWSRLSSVYDAVIAAGHGAFDEIGVRGYLMCHLSHSYHSGACLYFTFAFVFDKDPLGEYDHVKSAIQQAFVDNGSSISHHHGVGLEHAPWLEQDISSEGVKVMSGLFSVTDPGSNLNPRKIIADATKARSGPGTTKKIGSAKPVSTPAARVAAQKKTKVSAS
jgi:alkyldihydroxyacetonephosphate synthase